MYNKNKIEPKYNPEGLHFILSKSAQFTTKQDYEVYTLYIKVYVTMIC